MENTIVEGTLETNVRPEQVLDILEIPQLIPRWAPAFADRVEPHGQGEWQVTKNDTVFHIEIESSRATQTVEYIRKIEGGKKVGASFRLLHRIGGGCIIKMTLPLTSQANRESVERLLYEELNGLVDLSRNDIDQKAND